MIILIIISSCACLLSIIALISNKLFNNRAGAIQFSISILAIVLSFIAVAVALPRKVNVNVEMDYLGMITSVLGIFITILIGWQLYSVFKIKDDVADAEKARIAAQKAEEEVAKVTEASQAKLSIIEDNVKFVTSSANNALSQANQTIEEAKQLNTVTKDVLKTVQQSTAEAIAAKLSAASASEAAKAIQEAVGKTFEQIKDISNNKDQEQVITVLFMAITELYLKEVQNEDDAEIAIKRYKAKLIEWQKQAKIIINNRSKHLR